MNRTILFLCPHNAAKSVIAAAHFNQKVSQAGLPFTANSAGTVPSKVVSSVVVTLLKQEGLDVSQHQSRHVTAEELQAATHIISMGCTSEELAVAPKQVELWSDVPLVSQEPERARDVIRTQVEQLIAELRTAP